MNKADKEITKFINEYRVFLVNNHIDVAQSTIDNTWFVYRYCGKQEMKFKIEKVKVNL